MPWKWNLYKRIRKVTWRGRCLCYLLNDIEPVEQSVRWAFFIFCNRYANGTLSRFKRLDMNMSHHARNRIEKLTAPLKEEETNLYEHLKMPIDIVLTGFSKFKPLVYFLTNFA